MPSWSRQKSKRNHNSLPEPRKTAIAEDCLFPTSIEESHLLAAAYSQEASLLHPYIHPFYHIHTSTHPHIHIHIHTRIRILQPQKYLPNKKVPTSIPNYRAGIALLSYHL